MLSIQNYKLTPVKITFKAEQTKSESNKENKPPFQSNYGLKTGAVYSGMTSSLALLGVIAQKMKLKSDQRNLNEEISMGRYYDQRRLENIKKLTSSLNRTWITIPFGVSVAIGCGVLVDKLINKKHTDFAEQVKSKPAKEILEENDNVEVSPKGNMYLKTNIGKKVGTILGAVVAPIASMISLKIAKFKIHPIIPIFGIFQGAIGGLVLGAITDYYANKNAQKHADTNNEVKQQ